MNTAALLCQYNGSDNFYYEFNSSVKISYRWIFYGVSVGMNAAPLGHYSGGDNYNKFGKYWWTYQWILQGVSGGMNAALLGQYNRGDNYKFGIQYWWTCQWLLDGVSGGMNSALWFRATITSSAAVNIAVSTRFWNVCSSHQMYAPVKCMIHFELQKCIIQ